MPTLRKSSALLAAAWVLLPLAAHAASAQPHAAAPPAPAKTAPGVAPADTPSAAAGSGTGTGTSTSTPTGPSTGTPTGTSTPTGLGTPTGTTHEATPPPSAPAPTDLGFAQHLFADGDYYRAVGEFERFVYFHPDDPLAVEIRFRIAASYLLGGQWERASELFGDLKLHVHEPALQRKAAFARGHAAYIGGNAFAAIVALTAFLRAEPKDVPPDELADRARLVLGWAFVSSDRLAEAADTFDQLGQSPRWPQAAQLAADLRKLERGEDLPQKSPVLAGVLSIVPGLGHVYIGRADIGAVAFLWNAIFLYGTLDSFIRTKAIGTGVVLAVFESLWYTGAIFGAVGGAYKFNRDARLNALEGLKARYPYQVGLEQYERDFP